MPDLKSASGKSAEKNQQAVRALVIEVQKSSGGAANGLTSGIPGASNAVEDETFTALGERGRVLIPPFDMLTLSMLQENSSELGQCIEAMEMNIEATGFRFKSRLRMDDITPTGTNTGESQSKPNAKNISLMAQAKAEKVFLTNFFQYATAESFIAFRRRLRKDMEGTGNGYFEVIRSASGQIQGFTHLPSYQMRLGRTENEQVETTRKILELQIDGSVKIKAQSIIRRFRTYVQSRTMSHGRTTTSVTGHKVVWYKEFGDKRHYDKHTGNRNKRINKKDRATEVIHLKLYSPRSPYGLPRFIGNLLSIMGARAAEEINWTTFRNNNIPSMLIAVSNGQLTQGSIERVQSFVESQVQGSDNYSKFLLIEAETLGDEEGEDGGQVKIDVKPLTGDQHTDAMFQVYSQNNEDRIRRAFRLPPIFVGQSKDYTRATAESSRRLADEQIFAPERKEFDEVMNRLIFPEMGITFHKFHSNTPNTTDNTQLVKILSGAEKTGGITPRIARHMIEDILSIDLPDFGDDFPADIPFSLTMAEAVKNQADPTEPGQQVTAMKTMKVLKALGILEGEDGIDLEALGLEDMDVDDPESIMEVAKSLLAVHRAAEISWRSKQDESAE